MFFSSLSVSPSSQPLVTSLVVLAFFSSLLCHRILAEELQPEQVRSGSLLLRNGNGSYDQAINLATHANVTINGMTAQVHVTQRFENQSSDWSEAIYVFPLPEDAAIYAMQMRIGERVIIGKIEEKAEAQKLYTQAKRAGKMAALTEQERPNLFTQKVANIPPGATIEVDLYYQHRVIYDMGAFSWRLPTTITPRYIPGNTLSREDLTDRFSPIEDHLTQNTNTFGWAQPTDQVPDAHRITPKQRPNSAPNQPQLSIHISLASGLPLAHVRAPYHTIEVQAHNNTHSVTLSENSMAMDRDFVLEWLPQTGNSPAAGVFSEALDGEHYANVMLVPPQSGKQQALPRDLVFVIDTSGSMAGVSIRQARQSLLLALNRLQVTDRFNIIQFNSQHSSLFSTLVPANATQVAQAKLWVGRLRADGGTEMLPALNTATQHFSAENRLQQLVFITDGSIGNESELFQQISKTLGNTRLFTVGIGSAPNAYFMKKAADFGRGAYTYIGDVSEVASKMNELFMKLETAMATNIQVDWGDTIEQYPQQIPDLYAGEPLQLTAKIDPSITHVTVSGVTQDQAWSKILYLNTSVSHNGIARNWARAKIEALEDSKITGSDQEQVREQVLSLALHHQLVTPYTSFVAIEDTVSRPPSDVLVANAVPNAMPTGSLQAVPFSRTATPAPLMLWLGLVAFAGFLQLRSKVQPS